ncbi:glycosyl hydrolase family 18 protein [Kitasatospora sp. NPDC088783]|uniref:glycosyl hydrolase family 18 protein n=1 Tax=Kitasatospora sp. NPDC088783 TaxID=3364077 RepID=UPI0038107879
MVGVRARLQPEEAGHLGQRRETRPPELRVRPHPPVHQTVLPHQQGGGQRLRPERGRRRGRRLGGLRARLGRGHLGGGHDRHLGPAAGRQLQPAPQLKAKHPHLKVRISLGGWSYSKWFSDAAATDASRKAPVSSCIDLDWARPNSEATSATSSGPPTRPTAPCRPRSSTASWTPSTRAPASTTR